MAGTPDGHDWITVHRVRLNHVRNGVGNPLPGPNGAVLWRFSADMELGGSGLPTYTSDVWGGFALHPSRVAAEAAFAAGDAGLPFAGDIVEGWHALAVPIRHHGTVLWRNELETDTGLRVAAKDPGGPFMVMTTGGFDAAGPDALPRICDFLKKSSNVVAYYRSRPENLRAAIFSAARVDGRDGVTMSLWKDLPAMMTGAYKPGVHADYMAQHRAAAMSDRTSFTRLRILASSGSLDGDPLAGCAWDSKNVIISDA